MKRGRACSTCFCLTANPRGRDAALERGSPRHSLTYLPQILAHDDSVEDHASAAFYFNDIADCNDAAGEHSCIDLDSVKDVSDEVKELLDGAPEANTSSSMPLPSCWILSGVQRVAKFKESERNELAVHLAVVRIPSVDSDIVVHMNQPINISAKSSSTTVAHATAAGTKEEGMALFRLILRSLKVKDWGLFDGQIDEEGTTDEENETPNMAPA